MWVEQCGTGFQVNFQPDNKEEELQLDRLLSFDYAGRQLSSERDRSVEEGAPSVARLGGHESQRWIQI